MPFFIYVAKDRDGKTVTGTVEAGSSDNLLALLREKEFTVVDIIEKSQKTAKPQMSFLKERVTTDDLVVFSRQLATLVSSGIPLVAAFDIIGEQLEKKSFKDVVYDMRDSIEAGGSLSGVLEKHSDTFSKLFCNMVKAGESSGMLDEILERLAVYLEKTTALQKKIRSAMIYPAIVTLMAVAVTTLLMIKVIPIFKEIYLGFGAELPRPTTALLAASDFLRNNFLQGIVFLSVAWFLLLAMARTQRGRYLLDSLSLKLPIFGTLLRKLVVSRFTRTLSTLVKSGVPILTCLEIVSRTVGNSVIEEAINRVQSSVKEGESIAEPLRKSNVFPAMVVRMISVGEKTGQLDTMLTKISDFYDEQVDTAVSGLTSIIEPLIIAFLGIVIGGIVICMFLPIFRLSTIMG